MVNFLILLNAMFGERDAFSADNRFRSALRFIFIQGMILPNKM